MTDAERKQLQEIAKTTNQLVTSVALLQQSNEDIIKPALKNITQKLDLLNFYTKEEVDNKLKNLQKKRWYENTLSASVGVILALIVTYFWNLFLGR